MMTPEESRILAIQFEKLSKDEFEMERRLNELKKTLSLTTDMVLIESVTREMNELMKSIDQNSLNMKLIQDRIFESLAIPEVLVDTDIYIIFE